MAARAEIGICSMKPGNKATAKSNKTPWATADAFVREPACTLAELRTITAETGMPPKSPHVKFPAPCAISSRFGGVMRRCGSILSAASMLNSDSMLATKAKVKATLYVASWPSTEKSGKIGKLEQSELHTK